MQADRLKRLLNPKTAHCFDVAVDHGFFGELSFSKGIDDVKATVRALVGAAPEQAKKLLAQIPRRNP